MAIDTEKRMRYRLQRKETIFMPCIIGNHSYPLPTYRWKDIAISDDRTALEAMIANKETYRVIDTETDNTEER